MFNNLDERKRDLLTSALMFGAGMVCLLAVFVGHVRFGALLAKIGTPLVLYGGMKLWRAVGASQTQSSEPAMDRQGDFVSVHAGSSLIARPASDEPGRPIKSAIVWFAAGSVLLWSVWPTPNEDFGIVVRIAGVLAAYAILRLGHAYWRVSLPGAPPASPRLQRAVQPRRTLTQMRNGTGILDKACALFAGLGYAVIALSIVCLAIAVVIWNTQDKTVMVTDRLGVDADRALPAGMIFSLIVGFCWSRMMGGTWGKIVLRTPLYAFVEFSMLMVPMVITVDQLAEAVTFHDVPTVAKTYRIAFASPKTRKGQTEWHATIDPYQQGEPLAPTVPIDEATFAYITAHTADAPARSNGASYGPNGRWQTTNLCLALTAQRTAAAERIILPRGYLFTVANLKPCLSDAK